MKSIEEKVADATAHVRARDSRIFEVGLILGSGLGSFADDLKDPLCIPTAEIPHYASSTVEGHSGQLVLGGLGSKAIAAFRGRVHYYEGYPIEQVTLGVRLFRQLGVRILIVTNAAGGVNLYFKPGDLMIMTGHVNMFFDNPLRGPNVEAWGPRFPDMCEEYDPDLAGQAEFIAREMGIPVRRGVYWGSSGPTYETRAEVRMIARCGADAVGMSTVPETIVAKHCGMRVLGISCITNKATGLSLNRLSHDEVTETAGLVREKFQRLLHALIQQIR